MLDWIRRIRKVSQTLTLPSRDASAGRSQTQLNPAKLIPATEVFFSQLSQQHYLIADLLSDDSKDSPSEGFAERQREIASSYSDRGKELEDQLLKLGSSFMELQQDMRDRLDALVERTEGYGWHEDLMRIYIVFGLLEDCQLRVAKGLQPAKRVRVEAMLSDNSLMDFCEQALSRSIADNPQLANELALFGRAIVADALLEVRDMVSFESFKLSSSGDQASVTREKFKVLEPLTSELIAQHTLRMDALGLTA
ncbi:MAG: ferritin-like fold-containing protein [Aquiluna sp.]|jgi:hypothetical protein